MRVPKHSLSIFAWCDPWQKPKNSHSTEGWQIPPCWGTDIALPFTDTELKNVSQDKLSRQIPETRKSTHKFYCIVSRSRFYHGFWDKEGNLAHHSVHQSQNTLPFIMHQWDIKQRAVRNCYTMQPGNAGLQLLFSLKYKRTEHPGSLQDSNSSLNGMEKHEFVLETCLGKSIQYGTATIIPYVMRHW